MCTSDDKHQIRTVSFSKVTAQLWLYTAVVLAGLVCCHGCKPKAVEPATPLTPKASTPAKAELLKVSTREALDQELKKLSRGQYAVIAFPRAARFMPRFQEMAKSDGGRNLWLFTEDEKLEKEWSIHRYAPFVLIVNPDHQSMNLEAVKLDDVLALLSASAKKQFLDKRDVAFLVKDPSDRSQELQYIASALAVLGLGDKSIETFQMAISTADEITNTYERDRALDIAYAVARAGLKRQSDSIFKKLIKAAETIEGAAWRYGTLSNIASCLSYAGLKDESLRIYQESIATAETIDDIKKRSAALEYIAESLSAAQLGEKGSQVFQKAISTAEGIKDPYEHSMSLMSIASSLFHAGMGTQADEIYKKALATTDGIEELSKRSKAIAQIASSLSYTGLEEATLAAIIGTSVTTADKISDPGARVVALVDIASVLTDADLQKEAAEILQKTITTAEKIEDALSRAAVFMKVADVLGPAGLKDKQREVYKKAIAAAKKIEDSSKRSTMLQVIGDKMESK